MNSRIELGRIAGIPILLDMMFVLVLIFFTYPYFTSGNTQLISAGLVVIAGLLGSILLHELGHAFAARIYNVNTRDIELTGLGGVAHFQNSLPRSVFARTVIYLAGPAANLVLWLGLEQAAFQLQMLGKPWIALTCATLAGANYFLLIFNLLPAYPLDGGRTLDAWLARPLGPAWSVRVVATLGLLATAGCVLLAIRGNLWMLLLAFTLFQYNWGALQSVGGFGGGRR
jgi:Zn-dependent protease